MTKVNMAKQVVRFMQYAALLGACSSLVQGNWSIATSLFLLALSIEKMLATVCFNEGYGSPGRIQFSLALSEDGFSYPSQAFGLFANTCAQGISKIKECARQQDPVDVETPSNTMA